MEEIKHYINGQYVGSAGGKLFDNVNPANGKVISKVHEAALGDPWGKMQLGERTSYCTEWLTASTPDEPLDAECLDIGKPKSLASHIDNPHGAANFKVFADMIKNVPAESFEMSTPEGTGALNCAVRRPKVVIGVISPWDLPLLLTRKVGPALACGNNVGVKPSEEPLASALQGEVMKDAGVPDAVFNVVHGFGVDSAGAFLTEHPLVDGFTFTGETGNGEVIMKAAARGVRDISLELGGKNAGLVFADCDMDKAIEGTMRSAFANCGQVCLGTDRVYYLERSIFDEFVGLLKEAAVGQKIGAPDDAKANMGRLDSLKYREKVLSYYQKAVDDGATVVTGGGIPGMPEELAGGAWVQPTIWTGLREDSAVITDEIFGPCVHLRPFDIEKEAIEQANSLPYGLASAIWSENITRAHRFAGHIEVGIIWVQQLVPAGS